MVAESTHPPRSRGYGITSVPPPEKLIRSGALARMVPGKPGGRPNRERAEGAVLTGSQGSRSEGPGEQASEAPRHGVPGQLVVDPRGAPGPHGAGPVGLP